MAAKKAASTGGAREGAGRKALYGEPLSAYFTVRVNDEQGAAIGAWCVRRKMSPATLVREVGLLRAGAESLGIGVKAAAGTAEKTITLAGAACFPVKCTERQKKAIAAYCARKRIQPGTFLKEAVLEYVGASKLGGLAEATRVSEAVARH
jgi:hypothetical protein